MMYSHQYWNDKKLKPYPVEWSNDARENLEDNDGFGDWFNSNFEINIDGKCSKKRFEALFGYSPFKDLNYKDEFARMRIQFKYNKDLRFNGEKGIFVGFKEISNINEENIE